MEPSSVGNKKVFKTSLAQREAAERYRAKMTDEQKLQELLRKRRHYELNKEAMRARSRIWNQEHYAHVLEKSRTRYWRNKNANKMLV
jgi:hypothetical protein